MKLMLSHLLCVLIGMFLATYACLSLSRTASMVWQENVNIYAANLLRLDGAKASQEGDWSKAEQQFRASRAIAVGVRPRAWNMTYPLTAWSLSGLVEYPDNTFLLSDLAVEAYSLQKAGKLDKANDVYAILAKKYPSKNRAYFDAVAEQTLSALSTSPLQK